MTAVRELINRHAKQTFELTNVEQRRLTQQAFAKSAASGFHPQGNPSLIIRVFSDHFSAVVDEVYSYTLDAIDTATEEDDLTHVLRDMEVDATIFRDRLAHAAITAINDPKLNREIQRHFDDLRLQKHTKFSSQLALKIRAAKGKKAMSQNINFNAAASGVQIGNYNNQTNTIDLRQLISQIESSKASEAEKEEAKGLIRKLLGHPLVNTIAGAAATALASTLGAN